MTASPGRPRSLTMVFLLILTKPAQPRHTWLPRLLHPPLPYRFYVVPLACRPATHVQPILPLGDTFQAAPSGYLEPPGFPRCGCVERQALKWPSCQEEDRPAAFPCRLKGGCKQQRRLRGTRSAEQQQRWPRSAIPLGPCRAACIQHPPQRLRHLPSTADQSGLRCHPGPSHTGASLATAHSFTVLLWSCGKGKWRKLGLEGSVEEAGTGENLPPKAARSD